MTGNDDTKAIVVLTREEIRMLEYKCEREGTHFAAANPKGTTKECSRCGVETEKSLWVREHSCPACGYTADRDVNAAENILQRGLSDIGMGYAEPTPSETATATETDVSPVPASRVIEQGSPPSSVHRGAWANGRVGRKSLGRFRGRKRASTDPPRANIFTRIRNIIRHVRT
jgi:ribosomal protein L37E